MNIQIDITHLLKFQMAIIDAKLKKNCGAITCSTTHGIYLIKCPCGLAYVGKTCRTLCSRISDHHSNIRYGDEKKPGICKF